MIHINVHIHIKEENTSEFINATLKNSKESLVEPGIYRFDFIQQTDDLSKFILIEVYRDEEAMKNHKETIHYKVWRDTVADMMLEPRYSQKFQIIFPT